MTIAPELSIARPGIGAGFITFEVFESETGLCCGIYYFIGRIELPPKQWLAAVRREMRVIEDEARAAGCLWMHLRGLRWAKIFPDYEPLEGVPNGLRKRLI